MLNNIMRVTTRSGQTEKVSLDAISNRIERLAYGLSVDPVRVSANTVSAISDLIRTTLLDDISAEKANDGNMTTRWNAANGQTADPHRQCGQGCESHRAGDNLQGKLPRFTQLKSG